MKLEIKNKEMGGNNASMGFIEEELAQRHSIFSRFINQRVARGEAVTDFTKIVFNELADVGDGYHKEREFHTIYLIADWMHAALLAIQVDGHEISTSDFEELLVGVELIYSEVYGENIEGWQGQDIESIFIEQAWLNLNFFSFEDD